VRVRHSTIVSAGPERTYAALRAIDLNRSRWIRLLFAIRSLPERMRRGTPPGEPPADPFLNPRRLSAGWSLRSKRIVN